MPSLKEYFNNDFKGFIASIDSDIIITAEKSLESKNGESGETFVVKRRIRHNEQGSCRLFTFYIPERTDTLSIIIYLLENLADHKKESDQVNMINSYENDLLVGTHNLVLSNRLYFYTESELGNDEVKYLDDFCKQKNIYVTVRSPIYMKTRTKNEKPLAFISHDSRNKKSIAKPLAEGLSSRLCSVWYDEFSLKVGQSLRESIETGIKDAKKCILILTPEFLENPGWTKKEFNSIFTKEMIFNQRIVIPIWHKVAKENVYEYSPSLADTVALIWPDSTQLDEKEYEVEVEKVISKIHTAVTE